MSSIQALAWLNAIVKDDSGDESEGENVVQEEKLEMLSREGILYFSSPLK